MEVRPLGRTGLAVSALSLGGAAIGQQYGPVTVAEVAATIDTAFEVGINLIDTSAYYGEGRSEEILGEVLAGRTDDYFLCTKAGRMGKDRFDFSARGMRDCLEGSLRRLRRDRVDILLAHDIEFARDPEQVLTETADTLHALKAEGKARFIGMSALPLAVLQTAIERCSLDVVITYCHYHLQDQTLAELLPVAAAQGVGVINASPLAMGLFTEQGPPPWHPAGDAIKSACRAAVEHCRRRGISISALAMQFCLAQPGVASTLTGTAKREELLANLDALATPMDVGLLNDVQAILKPVMNATWPSGRPS
jgi:L-galactose dehydrogenase